MSESAADLKTEDKSEENKQEPIEPTTVFNKLAAGGATAEDDDDDGDGDGAVEVI
jgi:hypothetical protein